MNNIPVPIASSLGSDADIESQRCTVQTNGGADERLTIGHLSRYGIVFPGYKRSTTPTYFALAVWHWQTCLQYILNSSIMI